MSSYASFAEQLRHQQHFLLQDKEHPLLEGVIVHSTPHMVWVDVGLKMNLKLKKSELFCTPFQSMNQWNVGERVCFQLESFDRYENNVVLSYEKGQKYWKEQAIWDSLQKKKYVNGRILNSVHGGYSVGIAGIVAFLPKNHVGDDHALGQLKTFSILKANREKKNVIVSRFSALEAWKKKQQRSKVRWTEQKAI